VFVTFGFLERVCHYSTRNAGPELMGKELDNVRSELVDEAVRGGFYFPWR
jgi:hypothetical protein